MALERIYLLADMHLKPLDAPDDHARRLAVQDNQRLARFLRHIAGDAGSLILLGDVFNFWFERNGRAVGNYGPALALFKAAADNGLPIHHIRGNRDYAVGSGPGGEPGGFLGTRGGDDISLLARHGIVLHGYRYSFSHAGGTTTCVHGDALCTGDRPYMLLRRLLQGPIGRTVMRLAPWRGLDFFIGGQQARTGVRNAGRRAGGLLAEASIAEEAAAGTDLLLCGHIHDHHRREVEAGGRTCRLVALPAWLNGWYGVLENGEVAIERFEIASEEDPE